MNLLSEQEINDLAQQQIGEGSIYTVTEVFARAVEAAVIAKLATVSVEPVAYVSEDELGYVEGGGRCGAFYGVMANAELKDDPDFVAVYTGSQLAAARVQAIEEAAKVCAKQLSPLESADRSWNAATRSCIRHINALTNSYETSLQTPSSDQSKAQGLS